MAEEDAAGGDAKDRGGLGKAAQAATGKNTGGGQLGKDDLIAQHPAMMVPHRSQEVMSKEGGQGDTAAENTGAQTGDSNAQDTPVTDNTTGQNEKTDASGGPEVPEDGRAQRRPRRTYHSTPQRVEYRPEGATSRTMIPWTSLNPTFCIPNTIPFRLRW